jgi:RNA polymerase sigma-70 factor (ECF subfamily)
MTVALSCRTPGFHVGLPAWQAEVRLDPLRLLFAALEEQSRRLSGTRPDGALVVPDARPLETDHDRDLLLLVLREYPHGTRWFARLVTRHWPRVWTICQAVLLNDDDADDATQEAFLKAHRYLRGFRFECSFGTWLARIARTSALDVLAAHRRESTARARVARDPVLRLLWSPWRAPVPAGGATPLSQALERMNPSDRLILVLHDVEGMEYEELAGALELAPAAARVAGA